MTVSNLDFSTLPSPDIIDDLSFDEILDARKARFLEYAPDFAEALEYESDPLNVLLQVESYRELMLRQRLNEVAKANLLALATGSNLEHLGAFYGLGRSESESDDAYRLRIRARTIASSTAGSVAHYRSQALSAAPTDIRDISVTSEAQQSGDVNVTILANKPEQSSAVADTVRNHLLSDEVKMLTDTITVSPAKSIEVNVTAEIYLTEHTMSDRLDSLSWDMKQAWLSEAVLGWEPTPSWINAQLHKKGVKRVELVTPTSPTVIKASEYAVLGQLELKLKQ